MNLLWFLLIWAQAGAGTPPPSSGPQETTTVLGYTRGGVTATPVLGGKW